MTLLRMCLTTTLCAAQQIFRWKRLLPLRIQYHPLPKRVRWDKVDQTYYQQVISEGVKTLNTDATSLGSLDDKICKLNQILVSASVAAGPPVVRRVRRAKLRTWTPEIQQAVKDKNWHLSTGKMVTDLSTPKTH